MRSSELATLVLGAALAVYVLSGVMAEATREPEPASALPVAAERPAEPVVVESVEPAPPPPTIAELSPAVSSVLGAQGHTDLVLRSDLEAELPASVVGVLIDHDVVLRIADTADGPEAAR